MTDSEQRLPGWHRIGLAHPHLREEVTALAEVGAEEVVPPYQILPRLCEAMLRLPSGLMVQPVEQNAVEDAASRRCPGAGRQDDRPDAVIQDKGGVKTMPQLVKGGKWVFGWVIVGPRGELAIPLAALDEYRFQVGDEVTFMPGSRRSGGFGLSHARLLAEVPAPLQTRALAQGHIDKAGRVVAPGAVGVQPGDRLLAVRGSGRALGFVTHGPIYEEALKHPDLPCFGEDVGP